MSIPFLCDERRSPDCLTLFSQNLDGWAANQTTVQIHGGEAKNMLTHACPPCVEALQSPRTLNIKELGGGDNVGREEKAPGHR